MKHSQSINIFEKRKVLIKIKLKLHTSDQIEFNSPRAAICSEAALNFSQTLHFVGYIDSSCSCERILFKFRKEESSTWQRQTSISEINQQTHK